MDNLSFKCLKYVPFVKGQNVLLSKDKMSFGQRTKCPSVKGQNVLRSKDKMSFWKRTFCLLTKGHIWTLCPSMDIMSFEGHNVQICPFLTKKICPFKRTFCPFQKGHYVLSKKDILSLKLTFSTPPKNDKKDKMSPHFWGDILSFFCPKYVPFFFQCTTTTTTTWFIFATTTTLATTSWFCFGVSGGYKTGKLGM